MLFGNVMDTKKYIESERDKKKTQENDRPLNISSPT